MLPSVAARALDADPELLDLVCLSLLDYADAKAVFDRADAEELKRWKGNPIMHLVEENDAEIALDEMPSLDELRAAGYEVLRGTPGALADE